MEKVLMSIVMPVVMRRMKIKITITYVYILIRNTHVKKNRQVLRRRGTAGTPSPSASSPALEDRSQVASSHQMPSCGHCTELTVCVFQTDVSPT